MAKARRRQYIIDRRFQYRYIAFILIFVVAVSLLMTAVSYFTAYNLFVDALKNLYPQGRLVELLKTINVSVLVRISFFIPLIGLIAVFLSHKIAGPLFSINKSLDIMADKDFSFDIKLRKRDELKEVAERINNVIKIFRDFVGKETEHVKELEAEINKLKQIVPLTGDTLTCVNRLETLLGKINNELAQYKY